MAPELVLSRPVTESFYALVRPPNQPMRISLEHPNQPEVIALIGELDAYQDSLYPAEARYALDIASLSLSNVLFAVARGSDGIAIGCGAIVLNPSYGEVKRMYVRPAARGSGTASQIITALEAAAATRGCRVFMLETGPYQPEALAFYAKHGYTRCGPFGNYPAHPLSVFMAKGLDGRQRGIASEVSPEARSK